MLCPYNRYPTTFLLECCGSEIFVPDLVFRIGIHDFLNDWFSVMVMIAVLSVMAVTSVIFVVSVLAAVLVIRIRNFHYRIR
jgi:hypothetical protein